MQKFAREGLGTASIDHHRTGDVPTLLDALSGKTGALATIGDLYTAKAALVIGSDLAQQHPLIAYQLRANFRHHQMALYTVTPGPVREDQYSTRALHAAFGAEMEAVETLREDLAKHESLVIVFGPSVKGESLRRLVAFGDSLGTKVQYVCLVDYSNSRGAMDMGLLPELGPGYQAAEATGAGMDEMLGDASLDALWVVGANPLEKRPLASETAFVVVHELFLTETAQRADVVFPAASAYEKNGTVTNTCGEVQRLKAGPKIMGTKTDLEIMGLLAKEMGLNLGIWTNEKVFEEVRRTVRGYNVALPVIATGGAAQTMPVNGRVPALANPELIRSDGDTLFTSGSLGRYSKMLNSVMEAPGRLYEEKPSN